MSTPARHGLAGFTIGLALALVGFVPLLPARVAAETTQIEYWQYTFKQRVDAMDELIRQFQAANPDITVKQVTDQEKKKTPNLDDADDADTNAPERDIVLDETQRSLLDYVLLVRKQNGGITAR